MTECDWHTDALVCADGWVRVKGGVHAKCQRRNDVVALVNQWPTDPTCGAK